jgi:hypothetical protein
MHLTVDVSRIVQINAQDPASGQGEYQDIVRDLGCHEIGGNVELELDSLNIEDGKTCVWRILKIAQRSISTGKIRRHHELAEEVMTSCYG